MAVLYRDEHFRLEREAPARYATLTRSEAPFAQLDELRRSSERVIESLRGAGIVRVLFDLRTAGPGRHDAGFEAAGEHLRRAMAEQCERVAVLVKTMAGRLQARRLTRALTRPPMVYTNESEARAYLDGD